MLGQLDIDKVALRRLKKRQKKNFPTLSAIMAYHPPTIYLTILVLG